MANDKIVIRGAREHNLKDINLTIPKDKLVVITGLSGSGKSFMQKGVDVMCNHFLVMLDSFWGKWINQMWIQLMV